MDKSQKRFVEIANGIDHVEESQESLLKGGFEILVTPNNPDADIDINIYQCKCPINKGNCTDKCGPTSKESSNGNVAVMLSF